MKEENYNKEEWGGWKIVSDMLDNPDKNGIYPTSKCYQKLYEFVCEQKEKAYDEAIKLIEKEGTIIHKGELSHGIYGLLIDIEKIKLKL